MAIAFVFITTESASMPEVLKEVKAVRGVEEADMVYGIYDIVAKVKAETVESLKETVTKHIRRIDKVQKTITMMVVKSEYLK